MTTFGQVLDDAPIAVIELPPGAWSSDYHQRPRDTVQVGVRALSENDVQVARSNAAEYSVKLHRGLVLSDDGRDIFVDAYEDALLRWAVGLATCDPSSTEAPFFPRGEEDVRLRLTSPGARLVWEAIEREQLRASPSVPILADAEAPELARRLANPAAIELLEPSAARRVRKLLGFVLAELRATDDLL